MSHYLYEYLPPELRNGFIKAGHNKYKFTDAPDSAAGVKKVAVAKGKRPARTISADNAQRRVAVAGIKQGNASMKTERPVIAAQVARKAAIKAARGQGRGAVKAARQEGRAAVKAARLDPNSARSERRAARTKKTTESAGGESTPAAPAVTVDPAPAQRPYDDYVDAGGVTRPYTYRSAVA